MKYAHIDNNNMLLGYYDDELHVVIPTPNVALSEQQWQACISMNANKVNPNGVGEVVDIRTEEEISHYEANLYKSNRASEYPSIGDQLDALFHAGVFPDDMAAQIQAVKDKYPKGGE